TYLDFIAANPITFNQTFDLGGPEILSYKQMLLQFLQICNIKKTIITLPFVHSFFSTLWLSKNSGLPKMIARAFSENIQGDLLCENNQINDLFPHTTLKFKEALLESI